MTIVDDAILEFDHGFTLTLASTSDPPGFVRNMMSPLVATFNIQDDEGNQVVYHMLSLKISL